jgi:hypothetical protein
VTTGSTSEANSCPEILAPGTDALNKAHNGTVLAKTRGFHRCIASSEYRTTTV